MKRSEASDHFLRAVVVLVKKEGVTQVIHRKGAEEGKQNNSRREE